MKNISVLFAVLVAAGLTASTAHADWAIGYAFVGAPNFQDQYIAEITGDHDGPGDANDIPGPPPSAPGVPQAFAQSILGGAPFIGDSRSADFYYYQRQTFDLAFWADPGYQGSNVVHFQSGVFGLPVNLPAYVD